MTSEEIAEKIFDVVDQLNRGIALISDQDEKDRVAEFNLRAGKKAKASTAYASASACLSLGMDLLGPDGWKRRCELASSLCLEQAECAFLSGDFEEAERLIAELLQSEASKIDKAAAYRLKMDLHAMRSENPQAVDSALECLRLFGIEMPAHPTDEQVQAEYEQVWRCLGDRPIESLIDLPLMTDPGMQAAMRVLSVLFSSAFVTDINLLYLHLCHMVNVSIKHGTADASGHGYAWFGLILGPVFRRYSDGYRFGKLAVDLVEKHGFLGYKAKAYFSRELVDLWTQPITTANDFARAAFRTAVETGDLAIACYSCHHIIVNLLLRGDHLDEVWRESEVRLDFVRKAKFRDVVDVIVSRQRFIQNMRGRTATFSTFSGADFDEDAFEAQLADGRRTTMACRYWILKLQARFMSGDYEMAMAAAEKAKAVLSAATGHIQMLDYHYYAALAIAAVCGTMPPDRRSAWLEALAAHLDQLREWAENCSATFLDKHALVAAEVARLERRDLDAMRLYEEAIRTARENGFIQNKGLANELAARFYRDRGFETTAQAYLRNARYCYLRWGALGKVRQLDRHYPPREEHEPSRPTATIGASVEQLDLDTVVKASQAVSGEIVLEKLIETLMVIAVEHAGAERGLLILSRGGQLKIEAEATTARQRVEVSLHQEPVTAAALPEAILHYVIRTRDSVILDDASARNLFSQDEYVRRRRPRSVLCLPLVKQATLVGVLYLENNLTPSAFTPERIVLLGLLASQAAISLENARLYADLQQENSERKRAEEALQTSEERLRLAQEAGKIGTWDWDISTGALIWSDEYFAMRGLTPGAETPSFEAAVAHIHPDDRDRAAAEMRRMRDSDVATYDSEYRVVWPNGEVHWLGARGKRRRGADGQLTRLIGVTFDITGRKRAEEELARLNASLEQRIAARTAELVEANAQLTAAMAERERAEAALRQAQKMEAIGQLTAGIAHDFNNLLTAVIGNLDLASQRAKGDPPQARLLEGAARAAEHGAMLTQRLLAFGRKQHLMAQPVDAAALLDEMRDMLARSLGPTIQLALAPEPDLWLARVDPHQLELMIMNLAINARDAMPDGGILTITMTNRGIMDGVPSGLSAGEYVLITVQDTGMGMDEATLKRAFEPFFTTKEIGKGSGLGLSMVHGVAAQSGGTARARSRLGEGTRVEVWLPRAATARPPKSIAEPAPEATLVETTILLCDDDPEVRGFVGTSRRAAPVPRW
jgi:PAS domain S-box-containing protein